MILFINPDPDSETPETVLRQAIHDLLNKSDWTQLPDANLTANQVSEWAEWRQQIRQFAQSWTVSNKAVLPDAPTS